MIQDIAPMLYHNEYRPLPPAPDSFLLYFEEDRVLLSGTEEQICFPRFRDFEGLPSDLSKQLIYLFSIDKQTFYLSLLSLKEYSRQFRMESAGIFRSCNPAWAAFAGVTAHQLFRWYSNHHFCSCCGRPLSHSQKERMLFCPSCQLQEYPKISPAVIVGIIHEDKLLMSQYAHSTSGHYALIAGFAEVGETIEETVHREVWEEVGLRVKDLQYYKSQPWSFSDSLLFGFFAHLDGSDQITLDTNELACARWFTKEEVPPPSNTLSLTAEMILKFKNS